MHTERRLHQLRVHRLVCWVSCDPGQACQGGQCVDTGCGQDCPDGQVCDGTECVDTKCDEDTCPNGSYCDPLTGQCGNEPCSGVVCPDGEDCEDGQCVEGSGGSGGAGGAGGSGGGTSGTGGGTAGTGGLDGGTGGSAGGSGSDEDEAQGNWGLATGGGGCACKAANSSRTGGIAGLLMLGMALLARGGRRLGKRKGRGGEDEEAPRHGRDGGQR